MGEINVKGAGNAKQNVGARDVDAECGEEPIGPGDRVYEAMNTTAKIIYLEEFDRWAACVMGLAKRSENCRGASRDFNTKVDWNYECTDAERAEIVKNKNRLGLVDRCVACACGERPEKPSGEKWKLEQNRKAYLNALKIWKSCRTEKTEGCSKEAWRVLPEAPR